MHAMDDFCPTSFSLESLHQPYQCLRRSFYLRLSVTSTFTAMQLLLPRQHGLGGLPEEAIEGRVLCHSISRLAEPVHPRSILTICTQETVNSSEAAGIDGTEPGVTRGKACRCQQDEED